jgi:hypothetical protein
VYIRRRFIIVTSSAAGAANSETASHNNLASSVLSVQALVSVYMIRIAR